MCAGLVNVGEALNSMNPIEEGADIGALVLLERRNALPNDSQSILILTRRGSDPVGRDQGVLTRPRILYQRRLKCCAWQVGVLSNDHLQIGSKRAAEIKKKIKHTCDGSDVTFGI